MSFDDDLNAAQTVEKDFADVAVLVNEKPHTLRFYQMDGDEWAELTDHYPARSTVRTDQYSGYDMRKVGKAAAPLCGKRLDGENVEDLSAEQWEKLWKALSGAEIMRIGDTIWNLNQWLPDRAIEAAKKALGGSKKKSA